MTRNKRFLFLVLAVSIGLAACSSQTSDMEKQIAIGKAHFQGFGCTTCHVVGGEGGALGPDLTFIGFRKSPEWINMWLEKPEGWKHNTLMPNFHLNEPIRNSLVAYLSSLKGDSYADGKAPWNAPELEGNLVKKGESIFKHAGCIGCHGGAG